MQRAIGAKLSKMVSKGMQKRPNQAAKQVQPPLPGSYDVLIAKQVGQGLVPVVKSGHTEMQEIYERVQACTTGSGMGLCCTLHLNECLKCALRWYVST